MCQDFCQLLVLLLLQFLQTIEVYLHLVSLSRQSFLHGHRLFPQASDLLAYSHERVLKALHALLSHDLVPIKFFVNKNFPVSTDSGPNFVRVSFLYDYL